MFTRQPDPVLPVRLPAALATWQGWFCGKVVQDISGSPAKRQAQLRDNCPVWRYGNTGTRGSSAAGVVVPGSVQDPASTRVRRAEMPRPCAGGRAGGRACARAGVCVGTRQ